MLSVKVALEVLGVERDGLDALIEEFRQPGTVLGAEFQKAVDTIFSSRGKTVVTGMGKSGHVARKIAATLASTGSPAIFVHPGEASHGDLGMIGSGDNVLALSNSGETSELRDIITYCRRFEVPLIGMTSGPQSTLANFSSINLLIPKSKEACEVTRAPTTSTTQMIALGDALAVSLLRRRGFTQEDFHNFHPGGKLGAALKRVTELMHHTEMPLTSPDRKVSELIDVISEAGFGCAGIVEENGCLIGIVTDGDLRRHFSKSFEDALASQIMTRNPTTITRDSLAVEALAILSEKRITSLFIVDDKHVPLGLLHVHDCLSDGVI